MSLKGMLRFAAKSILGGPGKMLKRGDPAPDFETKDQHEVPFVLRDLRGKKVVLWFYPKADTPG